MSLAGSTWARCTAEPATQRPQHQRAVAQRDGGDQVPGDLAHRPPAHDEGVPSCSGLSVGSPSAGSRRSLASAAKIVASSTRSPQ